MRPARSPRPPSRSSRSSRIRTATGSCSADGWSRCTPTTASARRCACAARSAYAGRCGSGCPSRARRTNWSAASRPAEARRSGPCGGQSSRRIAKRSPASERTPPPRTPPHHRPHRVSRSRPTPTSPHGSTACCSPVAARTGSDARWKQHFKRFRHGSTPASREPQIRQVSDPRLNPSGEMTPVQLRRWLHNLFSIRRRHDVTHGVIHLRVDQTSTRHRKPVLVGKRSPHGIRLEERSSYPARATRSLLVIHQEEVAEPRLLRSHKPLKIRRIEVARVSQRLFDSIVVVVSEGRTTERLQFKRRDQDSSMSHNQIPRFGRPIEARKSCSRPRRPNRIGGIARIREEASDQVGDGIEMSAASNSHGATFCSRTDLFSSSSLCGFVCPIRGYRDL